MKPAAIQPQEFVDKAIEHYRQCNEKSRRWKKIESLASKIVGILLLGPIVLGLIVGLIAVLIKFIQICLAWIGL